MKQRLVLIVIIFLLTWPTSVISAAITNLSRDTKFSDITGSFATDSINSLVEKGILSGYPDGSFKPKNGMTRQEYAIVLAKSLNLQPLQLLDIPFTDVSPWAKPYVSANYKLGGTKGVSETKFGALQNVARQDSLVLLIKSLGYEETVKELNIQPTFTDTSQISDYAKGYIGLAEKIGLVKGNNGLFNPVQNVQRQDVAAIINNFMEVKTELPNQIEKIKKELAPKEVSKEAKQTYFVAPIALQDTGVNATTIAEMDKMRTDLFRIDPHAVANWALEINFLFSENQRPQLAKVLEYVDTYGDSISILTGFPNNNRTDDIFIQEMQDWLYMFRYNALPALHVGGTQGSPSILASIPERYRPKSVISYAINPRQIEWLRTNYGIESFMGWDATQYNVDQLSGEGSPLMPYYSHVNNSIVPTQSIGNSSNAIVFNSISVDPIGSRYTDNDSRWTIHPADPNTPEEHAASQIHTWDLYVDNPYRDRNTINYLSLYIDTNWILRTPQLRNTWEAFILHAESKGQVKVIGAEEFANIYKSKVSKDNQNADYTVLFRGSGYTTQSYGYTSPADMQYLWTETRSERIILQKLDGDSAWKVIDFTDYSKSDIPTFYYTQNGHTDDISYVTGRNYKLTPNAPLTQLEKARVADRMYKLGFKDHIDYNDVSADVTPPNDPQNITAITVNQTEIRVKWDVPTDNYRVDKYKVYLNDAYVGSVVGPYFEFKNLTVGTSYKIQVKAVDGAGNESGMSTLNTATKYVNLLNNGSFEVYTGNNNVADYWLRDIIGPITPTLEVSSTTVSQGSKSQKIESNELATDKFIAISQAFTVQSDKDVNVTLKANLADMNNARLQFYVEIFGPGNKWLDSKEYVHFKDTTGFETFSVSVPHNITMVKAKVTVVLRGTGVLGSGTLYLDDVFVKQP